MTRILAIAAGGALGSVLRYWLSNAAHALVGRGFPYGTLFVNVLGSLLMGFLFALSLERLQLAPAWRAGIFVGVLGGFTTFSAFSMETVGLLQEGAWTRAALNVALSVLLCIGAAWAGVVLARQL